MLSQDDIDLLEKCSKGEIVLFIAPAGREFENSCYRIMIDNSEISIISAKGDITSAAIQMQNIASNIEKGEWVIRDAHMEFENWYMEVINLGKKEGLNIKETSITQVWRSYRKLNMTPKKAFEHNKAVMGKNFHTTH